MLKCFMLVVSRSSIQYVINNGHARISHHLSTFLFWHKKVHGIHSYTRIKKCERRRIYSELLKISKLCSCQSYMYCFSTVCIYWLQKSINTT